MLNYLKNEKLWYAIGGAAAVLVGEKVLKSKKTRQLAVSGLAKGMKLQSDAKELFQNMKDEAADICYDAKPRQELPMSRKQHGILKRVKNEISDCL